VKRPLASTLSRIALRSVAGLIAIPFFYFFAAFVFALVPANLGWREPKQGVTIFVRTNGVHTWIMVPKTTPEMDWRPLVPGTDLKDRNWGRASHVAFGYGNRTFYLETPTWGDLTMKNAFLAAFGQGRSLMHADHAHLPAEDETQRAIVLTSDQYARLTEFILASFQRGANGRTIPLIGRGYSTNDMFYEAVGPYNAFLTCNEWTGRALRHAGVRTGLWTPLSWSIMWRLD
jgi:uncharacterized protein (TIGR02117 family)